jgi:outer membrane protein TolC
MTARAFLVRSSRAFLSLCLGGVVAGAAATAGAQTTLTLEEAMSRARTDTPGARALAASVAEASARVDQARSGFLPRIDVIESLQRGNDPVYVFSTLLSQRRFTAANFDVQRLNDPPAETNIRTAIALDQQVYDAGATGLGIRAAELHRDLAVLGQTKGAHDLAFEAARAFVRILQLEAAERAAAAAVAAAESDLQRARQRRNVGLVTDADVLSIDVHLSDVRQRQIATSGDLAVARIELVDALGLPLDQAIVLVKPRPPALPQEAASLARQAIDSRPESRQAGLHVELAENSRDRARVAFFPRVGVEASWAFNGSTWPTQRSSWIVGATVRWNVFNGFADRARMTEARQAATRAVAERERITRRIEVDVRAAVARVAAARARETAGRTALAQARESQRIIRDRYDAGLASVTDVLRAAEAVLDADARATAAETDVILETVALDRAAGRL